VSEHHTRTSALLLYPLAYAGGAGMSLCGGLLAMTSGENATAGIILALAGAGVVAAASVSQGIRMMRPAEPEDLSLPSRNPPHQPQG
jgi:hypothetical protein